MTDQPPPTAEPYAHKGDRPPWSWQGAVALTLAACLGGGWLSGIVLAAVEAAGDRPLDSDLAGLLNGIGQVLAGALGTYLGFSAGTAAVAANRPPSKSPPE